MKELNQSQNKAVMFSKANGSLVIKEFYDLAYFKSIECQALIMTNVITNQKIGCLRLSIDDKSYSDNSHIGTLDYDELDACIKSLNYMKEVLLPSFPNVYTEVEYRTTDDVKFGAFCQERWRAFIYTKGYTSDSAEFFDSSDIDELIYILCEAKQLIEEKTM